MLPKHRKDVFIFKHNQRMLSGKNDPLQDQLRYGVTTQHGPFNSNKEAHNKQPSYINVISSA